MAKTKVKVKAKARTKIKTKKGLSKTASKGFKILLLKRKKQLLSNVSKLEDSALKRTAKDAAGDISDMPLHIADLGTDTIEQEVTLGIMQNEEDELREIDNALKRIGDGTYGLCEICSKPISRERLKAIPYAHLCINCKKREEHS